MIFEAQVQLAARLKAVPKIEYLTQLLKIKIFFNRMKLAWYKEKDNVKKQKMQMTLDELELKMIELYNEYQEKKRQNSQRLQNALAGSSSSDDSAYKLALRTFKQKIKDLEKKVQTEEEIYKKIVRKYNPKTT